MMSKLDIKDADVWYDSNSVEITFKDGTTLWITGCNLMIDILRR